MGAGAGPLSSRAQSFPYYALGGALYLVGAVLVLYGAQGTLAELAEVAFLLAGTAGVIFAYLVDRGTVRPPRVGWVEEDPEAPDPS
jgi:hypothetical protein